MLNYLHYFGEEEKRMDGILLALEGISNFFGLFGEAAGFISGGWFFGQYLADFFTWLIEFGSTVAGFFG